MNLVTRIAAALSAPLLVLGLVGSVVQAPPSAAHAASAAATACAPPSARDPMPEGLGHLHSDPAQHRFSCNVHEIVSLDLRSLIPEPMMFGELDVAGKLAVLATTFPKAGLVTFDVADIHAPKPLARYNDSTCEEETDTNCGADVRLTPDAHYAFLAIQRSGYPAHPGPRSLTGGIAVIDLSDPARPHRASFTPVAGVGVHMLDYHLVKGIPYVFARTSTNGRALIQPGITIFRFDGRGTLTRINDIATESAHDQFLSDDPADGTTLLSISGAQSGKLFLYDVSDVLHPRMLGQWAPKIEVPGNIWYMHNAWTFRALGKRFTFVGAELYSHAGKLQAGHGTVAGPLWLLDTTDAAHPKRIGEWRNPGGHPAGDLTFSPHNTVYAEDGITWTAHYHGGVWILDWRDVMAGRADRPKEIGYDVPSALNRPFVTTTAVDKFITAPGMLVRPLLWDVFVAGNVGLLSDINGGLIVVERTTAAPDASAPSPANKDRRNSGGSGPIVLIGAAILAFGALPLLALPFFRRQRRKQDGSGLGEP